jgi:hypothetical protein
MPSELLAALLGAIVGFAGTYLIQRSQWRRAELDRLRHRLGAFRMLKIDLASAAVLAEVTVQEQALIAGGKFPTTNWFNHGHVVAAELDEPSVEHLTEAFGRFDMLNAHLAAVGPGDLSENEEALARLPTLGRRIADAILAIQQAEVQLERQLDQLEHPWVSRFDFSGRGGSALDAATCSSDSE